MTRTAMTRSSMTRSSMIRSSMTQLFVAASLLATALTLLSTAAVAQDAGYAHGSSLDGSSIDGSSVDGSSVGAPNAIVEVPDIALNRLTTAHEIVDREPVGGDGEYYADEARVFVFVDIHNPEGPEGEVTLQWRHESGRVFAQTLEYGQSRRWRTWASRRMNAGAVGAWEVEVFDAGARSLGTLTFEVLSPDDSDVDSNGNDDRDDDDRDDDGRPVAGWEPPALGC